MGRLKQVVVLSSDSEASEFGDDFKETTAQAIKQSRSKSRGLSEKRTLGRASVVKSSSPKVHSSPHSSKIGRSRGSPLSSLKIVTRESGRSDEDRSAEPEEPLGEADDEDEDIVQSRQQSKSSKGNEKAFGQPRKCKGKLSDAELESETTVRFLLDYVSIPASSPPPVNLAKKPQSVSLAIRNSPQAKKTRQANLDSFLTSPGASSSRPNPTSNRDTITSASTKKATSKVTTSNMKSASFTTSKKPASEPVKLTKTETNSSGLSDPDVVVTGMAKVGPRGKRGPAAAISDDESESNFSDNKEESAEESDEEVVEDPTEESVVDEDYESEEIQEVIKKPAPKNSIGKTTQSTLFGGTISATSTTSKPTRAPKGKGKGAAAKDVRNRDGYHYNLGIDESRPPLHDIGEIFDDLVSSLGSAPIQDLVNHLGSRKLKVATMCSGTESPILALDLIAESMKKHFGLVLEMDHLFSAEIVPFKQAYIERNFSPPVIFRDIKELIGATEATTAYGAKAPIPGGVDLLVAGFSCVDFSGLNSWKLDLNDCGESGDTFRAILNYAKDWRPSIIVLENVVGAPWPQLVTMWEEHANYSAGWAKFDTKQYYIPHTRQRCYMICIDNNKLKNAKNRVQAWKQVVDKMKRPASSPIEAFLLPEDDPRVHRGREEMSKGLRGGDKGPREVDWTRCQGRHQDYRADLHLGSKRTMTNWEDGGSCKMPDYAWNDWGVAQVERIWDTLEVSLLRNARRGFDSQFKTRVWDLSQNIDRFTDTNPFGITGCITPSGLPYITVRGGPIIGLESLAMQGLPIEKLLLTREHQKDLQDLAGNAMSTTVVGAAVLGALMVGFKALEPGHGETMSIDTTHDVSHHICGERHLVDHKLDLSSFRKIPVKSILEDVKKSSRLCLCEGRTSMTSNRLQQCKLCGHTTCVKCGGTPKHEYVPIADEVVASRLGPGEFESSLKDALPMRVEVRGISKQVLEHIKMSSGVQTVKEDWVKFITAVEPALGVELKFHSLKRAEYWTVFYDSPKSRLELILDSTMAEWRLFAKPDKKENANSRIRKLLARPFARMRPAGKSLNDGTWQLCVPTEFKFKVKIEGKGAPVRSWESKLGLQEPEFADKKLWSKLHLSIADEAISRLDMDVSGEYKLLPDCGTAAGCLHKKVTSTQNGTVSTPLFLFLDPSRYGNPTDDYFVFSTDIRRYNYGEQRPIIARLGSSWRPSALVAEQTVTCTVDGQWINLPSAELKSIGSKGTATYATPSKNMVVEFTSDSCKAANAVISCKIPLTGCEDTVWSKGDWIEVTKLNEKSTFASFAWLTERVRFIQDFDSWRPLDVPSNFKGCQTCAPRTPNIRWRMEKNKLQPYEDPQQAAPYERALKNRPPPFVTHTKIDDNGVGLFKIGLNISSLVHRAFANLPIHDSLSGVALSWRLVTNYIIPPKVVLPPFTLLSNKKDRTCAQPPNFRCNLRVEQLRSLQWMKQQEAEDVTPFFEEEVEESLLPHLGWRAEGRATKKVVIRGGVLADQVGYGKTATTLGLIDSQFPKEKKLPLPQIKGKISIKATLIIVPSTLVTQWASEIGKFLDGGYKVITINVMKSMTSLSIADFQAADIIITSWNVLNSETYLLKLAHFAALPEMTSTSGRAFSAWHKYALERVAEHVEILKNDGAQVLQDMLRLKQESFENDEDLVNYIPSKRLTGTAYRKAQVAKAQALPANKKRKSDAMDVADDGPVQQKLNDPFSLNNAGVRKDWRNAKSPLFQLFHYNRIVVDEYTYVAGKDHTCVTNLQSNVRWVLSGTPPLGDFVDVKTISGFLGINLGIDDDAVGVIQAHNIKAMEKDRTSVEEFQSFRQIHSPAWHQRRHEHAQEFLNQFVRQNIAEIDEIPFEEHLRCVDLPAAEKAIYMELHHHLLSQNMQIRKGRSKEDNDREERFRETIGDSKSPEEALLKRCCHFTLEKEGGKNRNATQACDGIVETRQEQHQKLIKDLQNNLKHAVWLKRQCREADEHFDGWKRNVEKNAFGDLEATTKLTELIQEATSNYRSSDETHFYKDFTKDDIQAQKSQEKKAKEKQAAKKKLAKKAPATKRRKRNSDDSDESILEDNEDDESLTDDPRKPRLHDRAEYVQALRDLTNHLRRLSRELVSRIRSLRFIKVVRSLQLQRSSSSNENMNCTECVCSKCGNKGVSLSKLSVLTLCGHIACDNCMETWGRNDECIVTGCDAAARSFHIVRAAELGVEDEATRTGRHYGKKLEAMIDLILHEIPKDDQILLFVQFEDLMEKVSEVLDAHGITHSAILKKSGKAAAMMSNFQQTTGAGKKKVLVLNVADESASGANLTNANHVIFLSPLFAESQYRYDSATTQAIGRARRYGQKKVVHISRFLALKTIDVDIIQERTGKRLVRDGNDYDLVPERDVPPQTPSFGSWLNRKEVVKEGDSTD